MTASAFDTGGAASIMRANFFQLPMKDHFAAYRKNALKKNAAIVLSSLVLAVSVNVVLFGTETGVRLQTSAIEYAGGNTNARSVADLSLIEAGSGTDFLKLRLASDAKGVKEFRATLLSDPSVLKIRDAFNETDTTAEIVKISNVDGVLLLNIRYPKAKDVPSGTDLATVSVVKSGTGKTVVNLAETSFVSGNGGTYELSNSPIEF